MSEKKFLTLSESSKVAKRSIVWLRRLCDEERLVSKKNEAGDWLVELDSLHAYMQSVEDKEALRLQRIEDGYKYPYTRPRVAAIKMVLEAINEIDATSEEKSIAAKLVKRIEVLWTSEYEKKYTKK